jgi:hypothetical protein
MFSLDLLDNVVILVFGDQFNSVFVLDFQT